MNSFDKFRFFLLRIYWRWSTVADTAYIYEKYRLLRKLGSTINFLLAPRKTIKALMRNFTIYLPLWGRGVVKYYYRDGVYELGSTRVVEKYLGGDDIFFDIGANVGYFSLLAAYTMRRKQGRGSVYAFEPIEENLEFLKKSITANQFENIFCFTTLVSDREGEADFYIQDNIKVSPLSRMVINKRLGNGVAVAKKQTISLDFFCKKRGVVPSFIKIDVEGAEPLVYRGAKKLISNKKLPLKILLEFIPDRFEEQGIDINSFIEEVSGHGFKIFLVTLKGELIEARDGASVRGVGREKNLDYNIFLLREGESLGARKG